jgi:hypothetical protein
MRRSTPLPWLRCCRCCPQVHTSRFQHAPPARPLLYVTVVTQVCRCWQQCVLFSRRRSTRTPSSLQVLFDLTCSISRVTWSTQLRHYCSARHHYEGSAHGSHRPIRLCTAHRGERAAILAGATPPPPPPPDTAYLANVIVRARSS